MQVYLTRLIALIAISVSVSSCQMIAGQVRFYDGEKSDKSARLRVRAAGKLYPNATCGTYENQLSGLVSSFGGFKDIVIGMPLPPKESPNYEHYVTGGQRLTVEVVFPEIAVKGEKKLYRCPIRLFHFIPEKGADYEVWANTMVTNVSPKFWADAEVKGICSATLYKIEKTPNGEYKSSAVLTTPTDWCNPKPSETTKLDPKNFER